MYTSAARLFSNLFRRRAQNCRSSYATETGAFGPHSSAPNLGRQAALFLGVPVAAKLGYDLAIAHEEYRNLDARVETPGVDIWNEFGRKEFMTALENDIVRERLGNDVVEDYGAKAMGEEAKRLWRLFKHGHIVDVSGERQLVVPLKGSKLNGAFHLLAEREGREWHFKRSFVDAGDECIFIHGTP
jgi:hypothetical protein